MTTSIPGKCPFCEMAVQNWTVNEGKGITKDGYAYCCAGCANGIGCICRAGRRRTGHPVPDPAHH